MTVLKKEQSLYAIPEGVDPELLMKVLGNPEMAALRTSLAIVSPYDGSSCEILHRHSSRDPFHHQKGQYPCLSRALDYIIKHDRWYIKKREASGQCH